jgi:BASS family bile acid:Na+ symporter
MLEILSGLLNIVVLVFAVSSMLSVGFSHTIREIMKPFRNIREVMKALLANFVLVPLLGYLIINILPLDRPFEVGLILVACAAGAPFLIKLTIVAGRDVALSTSLLVLLLPVTIIYLPLVVPIAIPEVTISAMAIATPLVVTMLLPLAIGFLIKAYFSTWATRLQPFLAKLSSITLILLVVITFIVNFNAILGVFGEGVIFTAILLIIGAFGIGYMLGGPGMAERDILGLGTAQRNIAAATVVATQGFEDRNTLVVVVLSSLLTLILLFPIAKYLRKREEKKYKTDPEAQEGII